jgi:hypothetical protein
MLVPQTEWNFNRGFGRPRVPRLMVFSSYSDINSAVMLDCGPESGFGFYLIIKTENALPPPPRAAFCVFPIASISFQFYFRIRSRRRAAFLQSIILDF